MKRKLFLTACCLLQTAYWVFAQQDVQYSQHMFNQLALNPAYAGSKEVLACSMLYRNQWTGIPGAPTTGALNVQMPLQKRKIGVGLEILSDRTGPKNVSALLFSYAYRFRVGKGMLAAGLRMGVYNYISDWNKMDYKDQSDLYNTGNRTSKFTGTGDFGWHYYTRTLYCGMAFTHLNRGKIVASGSDSSARQYIHFFIPAGKAFEVGKAVVNPVLLIKGTLNGKPEIDLGVNVLFKDKLWVGVLGRSGYGLVFLTQFQINDFLKAGYSYDYGVNKIGVAGKGSHEIMIGYDLNLRNNKMIMPRYL